MTEVTRRMLAALSYLYEETFPAGKAEELRKRFYEIDSIDQETFDEFIDKVELDDKAKVSLKEAFHTDVRKHANNYIVVKLWEEYPDEDSDDEDSDDEDSDDEDFHERTRHIFAACYKENSIVKCETFSIDLYYPDDEEFEPSGDSSDSDDEPSYERDEKAELVVRHPKYNGSVQLTDVLEECNLSVFSLADAFGWESLIRSIPIRGTPKYIFSVGASEECIVCTDETTERLCCCKANCHQSCLDTWFKNGKTCPHCGVALILDIS